MKPALEWLRNAGAVAALLLAFGVVGTPDYQAAVVTDAVRQDVDAKLRAEYRAARGWRQGELLCDCLKVNNGRWLRLQVTQQPDFHFCKTVCYYEGGSVVKSR